jgi:hypothetical protein
MPRSTKNLALTKNRIPRKTLSYHAETNTRKNRKIRNIY